MSAAITLPTAETRCRPAMCIRRHACARYLAPIVQHSPVGDLSLDTAGIRDDCGHYLAPSQARAMAQPAAKPPHEPVQGMS